MAAYENLAKKIMDAIDQGDHPNTVAKAIETYLLSNTLVTVSYSGIIPGTPPVPDPIVIDALKIKGTCTPLDNSSFDSYVKTIESGIVSGFELDMGLAGVTPSAPTLAFKTGIDLIQDHIKAVHKSQLYLWEEDKGSNSGEDKKIYTITSLDEFPAEVNVGDIGIYKSSRYICCSNPNPPNPQKAIWEEISKRIIDWLEKCSIGMSFSGQNTKSGSSGSAIVTKTEIT